MVTNGHDKVPAPRHRRVVLEQPPTVRFVTQADEAALFDLLIALYHDNGVGIPPVAKDVRAAIEAGTRRAKETGAIIGVIDGPDGALLGSIGIFPSNWWYNTSSWFLAERWLFVDPRARQVGRGLSLRDNLADDLFGFALWIQAVMETKTGERWPFVTSVTSKKRLAAKMNLWRRYAEQVGAIFVVE